MNTRNRIDFQKFDEAVRAYYGGISRVLEQECGCRIIKGTPGSHSISLWCPNHSDSKKNNAGTYLHCNDQNGGWRCWKCQNEGNHIRHDGHAIQAIMEYRHLDFISAFQYLAEKIGYNANVEITYSKSSIRNLYVDICHELLLTNQNKAPYAEAMNYIASRGFDDRTVSKYNLGFSTGFDAINVIRKRKGFTNTQLCEAGILKLNPKTGKYYPAFRDRVIMKMGANIYGRAINPNDMLRHLYTNSQNQIFNDLMLGNERDVIFVVESAFDALTVDQFIRETSANWCVIATCGTKGIDPMELVNHLKDANPAEVILIPDSDPWINQRGGRHAAGQKAGLDKARLLELYGLKVRIMVLPDNSDPNDLAKKGYTPAQFEQMVMRALTPAKYSIFCEAHYHARDSHSTNIGFLNAIRKQIIKYKINLSSEILDYLVQLTGESTADISRFMLPSLKESDALDYIRSEVAKGKSLDTVFAELRNKLVIQISA